MPAWMTSRDVAGILDHLRITGRVVLGGLSMGGYVAQAFAVNYADGFGA